MKKSLFLLVFLMITSAVHTYAQMSVNVIQANDSAPPRKTIPVKFEGKVQECYEYKVPPGSTCF